jgi:ribosomal-protein-alanine N-acetyltransferase
MAAEDIPAICAIERQEPSAWDESQVGEELELSVSIQLVASLAGEVIGWCCARHVGPEAELMKISVTGTQRHKKVSTRLLGCMEIHLLGSGVKHMFLDVRLRNAAAISFYRQAGFTELSRRIRYYRQPEDDALVFKKVIG